MAIRQNGRVVVWHQSVDKMCSEWGVGKNGYPSIIQGVEEILVKRYRPILDKRLHEQAGAECGTIQNGVPRIVWCAWLQGIEQAPALVKACIASQNGLYPITNFGS